MDRAAAKMEAATHRRLWFKMCGQSQSQRSGPLRAMRPHIPADPNFWHGKTCLPKPFQIDEFRSAVAAVLGNGHKTV